MTVTGKKWMKMKSKKNKASNRNKKSWSQVKKKGKSRWKRESMEMLYIGKRWFTKIYIFKGLNMHVIMIWNSWLISEMYGYDILKAFS